MRSITTSKPRATRSPIGASTSEIQPTSTCRSRACSPTVSRRSGGRSSRTRPRRARSHREIPAPTTAAGLARQRTGLDGRRGAFDDASHRLGQVGQHSVLHLHHRADGGSAITVPNHGFILNNELTDFEPVPGLANSPDGGKRPRSSISPTIVTTAKEIRYSRSAPREGRRSSRPCCKYSSTTSTSA